MTTCHYCRTWNADEEDRCLRCGRPLDDGAAIGGGSAVRVAGALATAPRRPRMQEAPPLVDARGQAALFDAAPGGPGAKIIPFKPAAVARPAPAQPLPGRRVSPASERKGKQGTLDLGAVEVLPPARQGARKLSTTVDAKISCEFPVAVKMHRAVAAIADLSMTLIGYGLFLLAFHFGGGDIVLNRQTTLLFGAAYLLICVFYGLLWLLARADSPGKRWAHLRLVDFDGFAPEPGQRLIRFLASFLSAAALGLGTAWAMVDEETLTWHDHISETFLTPVVADSSFVRQR